MEFLEGGQVNDREYMKKHCINVNEVLILWTIVKSQNMEVFS